jgi:hypothetical protein
VTKFFKKLKSLAAETRVAEFRVAKARIVAARLDQGSWWPRQGKPRLVGVRAAAAKVGRDKATWLVD